MCHPIHSAVLEKIAPHPTALPWNAGQLPPRKSFMSNLADHHRRHSAVYVFLARSLPTSRSLIHRQQQSPTRCPQHVHCKSHPPRHSDAVMHASTIPLCSQYCETPCSSSRALSTHAYSPSPEGSSSSRTVAATVSPHSAMPQGRPSVPGRCRQGSIETEGDTVIDDILTFLGPQREYHRQRHAAQHIFPAHVFDQLEFCVYHPM
jgi:hypothetical protein